MRPNRLVVNAPADKKADDFEKSFAGQAVTFGAAFRERLLLTPMPGDKSVRPQPFRRDRVAGGCASTCVSTCVRAWRVVKARGQEAAGGTYHKIPLGGSDEGSTRAGI